MKSREPAHISNTLGPHQACARGNSMQASCTSKPKGGMTKGPNRPCAWDEPASTRHVQGEMKHSPASALVLSASAPPSPPASAVAWPAAAAIDAGSSQPTRIGAGQGSSKVRTGSGLAGQRKKKQGKSRSRACRAEAVQLKGKCSGRVRARARPHDSLGCTGKREMRNRLSMPHVALKQVCSLFKGDDESGG